MSALSIDLRFGAGPRRLHSVLTTDARRIAIVGRSGIGKTSLLRAICGLVPADGRLALGDRRLDSLACEARGIGWVPQDGLLFPHLDVRRNLAFAHGAEADLDRLAPLLGLSALLDRDVATLSGGERQRVAIGRALAARPQLLVLDEPLSALDRAARAEIGAAIEEWRAMFDFAVLFASHDEIDVSTLADAVYVLGEDGTLTGRASTPNRPS
jgi:ABC-type molybdate transport system ATPase subunit